MATERLSIIAFLIISFRNFLLLQMFGAIRSSSDEIGFPACSDADGVDASNREKVVMPYIDAFAQFRDDVRKVAREQKVPGVLNLCDAVRDDILPHLGVRLEDKEGRFNVRGRCWFCERVRNGISFLTATFPKAVGLTVCFWGGLNYFG